MNYRKTKDIETEVELINEETGKKEIVKERKQEVIPGEYIYSLRYEEFISDTIRYCQILDAQNQKQAEVIKAQGQRTDGLEARLAKLEALLHDKGGVL